MKNVFFINQEEFFLSCKTKDDTGKLLDLVKQFFMLSMQRGSCAATQQLKNPWDLQSLLRHAGSSSLSGDRTQALCIGSPAS